MLVVVGRLSGGGKVEDRGGAFLAEQRVEVAPQVGGGVFVGRDGEEGHGLAVATGPVFVQERTQQKGRQRAGGAGDAERVTRSRAGAPVAQFARERGVGDAAVDVLESHVWGVGEIGRAHV